MKMFSRTLVFVLQVITTCTATQQSGHFDFLTWNVAGLPALINNNGVPGDKAANSRLIGAALGRERHDIVHLQEDFHYHSELYETNTHPVRTRTSGTVIFGDGLNTLSNYKYDDFTRVQWDKCSLNSGDCLTPKGFTIMRMTAIGFELHLYNLHADAGGNSKDAAARSAGIDQLLEAIDELSSGVPVIVAGDFNDRWTNSKGSIDKLTKAGFLDPWVDLIRNGEYPVKGAPADPCGTPAVNNECEVVDKIFYRSGHAVTLTATFFDYIPEDFLQPDGSILSDHNPLLVNFDWYRVDRSIKVQE